MNHLKRLTTIFAVIVTIQAHAQVDKGEIKVFNNNDSTRKVLAKENTNSNTLETMLKVSPLLLLEGDFPIYIEHQINKHISLEVAPGITFRNILLDAGQGQDSSTFTKLFYYPLPYAAGYKASLGYSFKIDGRYYFGNNMMDGMYLSPQIDYKHYVLNYPEVGTYGNTLGTYNTGHTNVVNFIATWGIETDEILPFGYLSENNLYPSNGETGFYTDYSVGFGMRLTTGKQGVTTSDTNNGITVYNNSLMSFSSWFPMIYLDIKIGFEL